MPPLYRMKEMHELVEFMDVREGFWQPSYALRQPNSSSVPNVFEMQQHEKTIYVQIVVMPLELASIDRKDALVFICSGNEQEFIRWYPMGMKHRISSTGNVLFNLHYKKNLQPYKLLWINYYIT